jgi:hypothetical protein
MKSIKDNTDDPSTLVDRLNGIYPAWVPGVYKPPPLNLEAAREIERLRAAPTPEVEPVGYIHIRRGSLIPIAGLTDKGALLKDGTPLYTRPAPPSELVKAAENLLLAYDTECGDMTGPIGIAFESLRAALDKVKSC